MSSLKPLSIKDEDNKGGGSVNKLEEPKMVDINTARQMTEEAADRATQKSMEEFKKYQEETQSKRPEITETGIDEEEINVFNPKTQRAIKNTVQTLKSFNEAFAPPPNPISVAIENRMGEMAADFVSSKLGGGNFASTSSKGLIGDILHEFLPAFGHGLGESLGTNSPETVKALLLTLSGQGNTKQLSDDTSEKQSENANSSKAEKQNDQILSLDVNNIEHLKQYATAMGLSEKAAKEILVYHQQDIISERNKKGGNVQNSNNELVEAIKMLANEMGGMKTTVTNLQNEIATLKGGKASVASEYVSGSRQVTLFQEPIKVDIDSIKGENLKDSFFDNKQQIQEAEMEEIEEKVKLLEQTINEKGNSHFRTVGSEDGRLEINKKVEEPKIIKQQAEILKVEKKPEQIIDQKSEDQTQVPIQHKRVIRKAVPKKEELIVTKEEETITNKEAVVSNEEVIITKNINENEGSEPNE